MVLKYDGTSFIEKLGVTVDASLDLVAIESMRDGYVEVLKSVLKQSTVVD